MLVFVIENTASMAAHINRLLSSYIEPLVQSIDGPLGLVQFSKQQAIIKLSTPKKPLIIETIKKMKMENGCCSYNALTEGLEKAVQLLNNIQGPKHIVIVSSTNGIGFQSVALSIQEKSINLSAILPLRGLKEIEEVCKNTSINDVLCQTDFISLNGLNINAIQKRKAESILTESENKIFKMTEEPGALVETSGEATNKTENTKQSPPISSVSVSGSTVTRRRQPVRKKSSGPKPKLEKKASVEVIKEEPTTKDTPIDLTSPIKTEPQPFGIQNAGIQLLQSQQQQLDAYNMLLKSQNSTPQSNVNTPQLGLNSNINGSQNQTMNNFTPQQQLALQQQLNRNANDPNYGQSILQKEQMAHQQLIAQNNASAGPATLGQQNLAQNAAVQQLLAQRMQMNNQFNLNQTGQRPPVNGVGNNFSGNVTSWSGQIAWSVMNPTLSQAQKLTISVRGTPIRNPNVDDYQFNIWPTELFMVQKLSFPDEVFQKLANVTNIPIVQFSQIGQNTAFQSLITSLASPTQTCAICSFPGTEYGVLICQRNAQLYGFGFVKPDYRLKQMVEVLRNNAGMTNANLAKNMGANMNVNMVNMNPTMNMNMNMNALNGGMNNTMNMMNPGYNHQQLLQMMALQNQQNQQSNQRK